MSERPYVRRERSAETLERICERIRKGTPVNHAAALEGWPKQRFYEWLGDDQEARDAVDSARAEGAEGYREQVRELAAFGGPQGSNPNVLLHLMERLYPDEYSPPKTRIEQEVSGRDGAPQEHHVSMDVAGLVRIARAKKEST
jgi:hypothetical protein